MKKPDLLFRTRAMIAMFVVLLILSGITAFPVYTELKWITEHHLFPAGSWIDEWLNTVFEGVHMLMISILSFFMVMIGWHSRISLSVWRS